MCVYVCAKTTIISVNKQTGVTHAEARQGKECQNILMKGRFKDQMLCECDGGIRGENL